MDKIKLEQFNNLKNPEIVNKLQLVTCCGMLDIDMKYLECFTNLHELCFCDINGFFGE